MPTPRALRCAACLSLAGLLFLLALLAASPGSAGHTPMPALAAPTTLSASGTYTVYLPLIERHVWVPAALQNGSFEGGTWRKTLTGEIYGEISVPENWVAFWNHDEDNWGRPEMRTIQAIPPYLNPPRTYSGTQALSWFTFYRNGDAGVLQQVPAEIGRIYRAQGYAHVWYSQLEDPDPYLSQWKDGGTGTVYTIPDGDPGMEVMIGIDPSGGQDPWSANIIWTSENIYDQYDKVTVHATAEAPTVTVFIRAHALSLRAHRRLLG